MNRRDQIPVYAWRLLRSFCQDAYCICVESSEVACEEWIDDWGHPLRRCIRCGHYPEAHAKVWRQP